MASGVKLIANMPRCYCISQPGKRSRPDGLAATALRHGLGPVPKPVAAVRQAAGIVSGPRSPGRAAGGR